MPNSWQNAYQELREFIKGHVGIEIEQNTTMIAPSLRPEFYFSFDRVRLCFLEEKCCNLLQEAWQLSKNYIEVEKEITALVGITDVSNSPSVHKFLHNPPDELIRAIFYPLFDLLKNKISLEVFEKQVLKNIEASFRKNFKLGYERWMTLSLSLLLIPDKVFGVKHPKPEFDEEEAAVHRSISFPSLEESTSISLKPEQFHSIIVPHFIIHSAKINKFVAVRMGLNRAADIVDNHSGTREWHSLKTMISPFGVCNIDPSVIILIDDKPEYIAVIADYQKICRPDLIIECKEEKEWWFQENELAKVRKEYDALKPYYGTYIVTREIIAESIMAERSDGRMSLESCPELTASVSRPENKYDAMAYPIRVLGAQYDRDKLKSIVESITIS
jgi:hypothetical protein